MLKTIQKLACVLMEECDGINPLLLLHLYDGQIAKIVFKDLPGSFEEKYAMLQAVGISMSQKYGPFSEAIFVSEAWMVVEEKDRSLDLSVRPSEYPKRKEAIIIGGKNVSGSISKLLILPFSREDNKIKWEDPTQSDEDSTHFTGILDALFSEYSDDSI